MVQLLSDHDMVSIPTRQTIWQVIPETIISMQRWTILELIHKPITIQPRQNT